MKLKWIAAAIVAAASTQASAQQAQMAAGLGISTVGPQIQLSYRQSTELGFRGFLQAVFRKNRHKPKMALPMMLAAIWAELAC